MKGTAYIIRKIVRIAYKRPRAVGNAVLSYLLPNMERAYAYPISADIEPTIACNLRCPMCHRQELAERRCQLTMDFLKFRKVVDALPTILKINLQGMGEPLLAKDFFKMVSYAKRKGIMVTTVTNGNLLTPARTKELIASGLDRIFFSVDSLDSEQYATYRPGGSIETVRQNIHHLMRERAKSGNDMFVGIWMLLFENNIDQVKPMVDFALSCGIDELVINAHITYRGKRDWKQAIKSMHVHSQSSAAEKIDAIIRDAKKRGLTVTMAKGMGAMKPTADARCQWPWKSIYVDTEGNVTPCCVVADAQVSLLGNIFKQKFSDIWNGPQYRAIRRALKKKIIPDFCKECYGKK